jgi:hypothetical protein
MIQEAGLWPSFPGWGPLCTVCGPNGRSDAFGIGHMSALLLCEALVLTTVSSLPTLSSSDWGPCLLSPQLSQTASSYLECLSSFSTADDLCRKLEDLQQFQKREPENEEEVDILSLSEPLKTNIKKEQEEKQEEMRFYLPPTPGSGFVGDITQKVGG